MTVTLNGPMEGKARFSGLPGGTALQGGEVGHYNCVMYNENKELTSVCYKDTYCHTDSYVHPAHSPTTASAKYTVDIPAVLEAVQE